MDNVAVVEMDHMPSPQGDVQQMTVGTNIKDLYFCGFVVAREVLGT